MIDRQRELLRGIIDLIEEGVELNEIRPGIDIDLPVVFSWP